MKFLVHAPPNGTAHIGAALTPTMTRPAGSYQSRGRVVGQPGTQAIPMPNPAAVRQGISELASAGVFSTHHAPPIIFPRLYWEAEPPDNKERAPVARISDNQMPVPAKRAPNVIVASPYRTRLGGQRQVVQPQVVQLFPGMRR